MRVDVETKGNFISADAANVAVMVADGENMWRTYEEPLKNFIRITMDERFPAGVVAVTTDTAVQQDLTNLELLY